MLSLQKNKKMFPIPPFLKLKSAGHSGTHTSNPSIWETEAGRSMWTQGQPSIPSKFQDGQGFYTEKPCLEKTQKQTTK